MKINMNIKKYATRRNLIILGTGIAAGIITLVIAKKRREAKILGEPDPGVIGALSSVIQPAATGSTWPLRRGSGKNEGEKALVRNVQRSLNKSGKGGCGLPIDVDGLFGPKTEGALQCSEGVSQVSKNLYNKMLSSLTGVKF